MPKEEIIEGLKRAIARGESLEKAMRSFYNSGYAREDIEEAAKLLDAPKLPSQISSQPLTQPTSMPAQMQSPMQKPPQQIKETKTEQVSSEQKPPENPNWQSPQQVEPQRYPSLNEPAVIQKVSAYGSKPGALSAAVIFILVFFLLLLLGALIAVFLFKDELSGFFNGLFIG